MKCPICTQELNGEAIFCSKCGKKVPRCPTCGEILYERSRFCVNDGTPLPEELFVNFPPAGQTEEVQPAVIPAPQPESEPPAPPQKKKKKGTSVAILVVVLLLVLAAIAVGTCYILQNDLPSGGSKADASSEDSSQEDGDREDEDNNADNETEKALETAENYAEDGDYEKALRTIQDALEADPDSRKLKRAQKEYVEAFETEVLAQAAGLVETDSYPAAIQALQAAQEILGGESEQLSARLEEYEKLNAPESEAPMEGTPAVSMDMVASIYASSYLSEPDLNLNHTPERTVDGDLSTGWVEGVAGTGTGESITFEFNSTCLISGIHINAGYQKSEDLYNLNARPASLTATFSDGTQQILNLQDVNSMQNISFSVPVETKSITLVISSVYSGTSYEDTVISELSFY